MPTPVTDQPPRAAPWFSGTADFTGYMRIVHGLLAQMEKPQRVLDIPAGLGHFTESLVRALGHEVTPADINGREGYTYVDMNERFPFDDDVFDVAVCLEGIEHLIDPKNLLGELIRVVRPAGRVIVSTPNIMSYHSRLKFLLTGTFYQFNPARLRDLPPDTDEDRFHVSPMSYHRMRYLADYFGADVERVLGDKVKRKILMPLYLVCHAIGWPWRRKLYFHKSYADRAERNRAMYAQINSRPVLFSRSLIMVLAKR